MFYQQHSLFILLCCIVMRSKVDVVVRSIKYNNILLANNCLLLCCFFFNNNNSDNDVCSSPLIPSVAHPGILVDSFHITPRGRTLQRFKFCFEAPTHEARHDSKAVNVHDGSAVCHRP